MWSRDGVGVRVEVRVGIRVRVEVEDAALRVQRLLEASFLPRR